MFSLIIKECGLSKIYRPIMMQARNYKKDISIEEKEKNKTIDKELQDYGKQLYYPKYGSSLYDDKINENLKSKQTESIIKPESLLNNTIILHNKST